MPTPIFNLSISAEVNRLLREWNSSSLKGNLVADGVDLTMRNLRELEGGIITQCAMQSRIGAKAIKDFAYRICPEKTGALKSTGRFYEVDVMEAGIMDEMAWVEGVGPENFTFTQKQRSVWEVAFGGESADGTYVDYAAAVHEAEGLTIHKDVNPEAEDHYLFKAYEEYKNFIPRRIVERVQAQIIKAGMKAAAMKGRKGTVAGPTYTDEVPF